jgi:hypothetical protein
MSAAGQKDTKMADSPDATNDVGNHKDRAAGPGASTSTPRWVKVFGLITLVLLLLFVVVHLAGGGFGAHTHSGSGGADGHGPPAAGHAPAHRPADHTP